MPTLNEVTSRQPRRIHGEADAGMPLWAHITCGIVTIAASFALIFAFSCIATWWTPQ